MYLCEFKRRLMEEAAKEKRSVTNYLEVTLAKIWERQNLEASAEFRRAREDSAPLKWSGPILRHVNIRHHGYLGQRVHG